MEWVILAVVVLGGYLFPSIIAVARRAPSPGATIAVNVLLGWTLLGWAAALAMALRSQPSPTVVQIQNMPPGQTRTSLPPGNRPPV